MPSWPGWLAWLAGRLADRLAGLAGPLAGLGGRLAGWLGWPAGLAKTSKEKVHEGQGNGEANWVGPDC